MKHLIIVAVIVVAAVLAPSADAAPQLTDAGYDALGWCESRNQPDIVSGNGYYGEVQWLPSTWRAAATGAGHAAWAEVLPDSVPRAVQRAVTKHWWSVTPRGNQWPNCYRAALAAMGAPEPTAEEVVAPLLEFTG